jgi:hypothetical protein
MAQYTDLKRWREWRSGIEHPDRAVLRLRVKILLLDYIKWLRQSLYYYVRGLSPSTPVAKSGRTSPRHFLRPAVFQSKETYHLESGPG